MFKFSVIVVISGSDSWLKETIDSIVCQSQDFEDNIQLILVNDADLESAENICLDYKARYPKNVKYIRTNNRLGISSSRNIGLRNAHGKYVSFINCNDYVSKNTFSEVFDFFQKHPEIDVASVPIYFTGDKEGSHILNFKYRKNQVVDLVEKPDYIQLSAASSFVKRTSIKDLKFDTQLSISEGAVFINRLLLNNPRIGFCAGGSYYYRKEIDNIYNKDSAIFDRNYFLPRIEHYFEFLIDESMKKCGQVLKFIQYTLMYDLQWIFEMSDLNGILCEDEIEILKEKLFNILQHIDDDVIYSQLSIDNYLKAYIVYFKHSPQLESDFSKVTDSIINALDLDTLFIDIFEIKNNVLYIMGVLQTYFTKTDIFCHVDGKKLKTVPVHFPQRDKMSLGETYTIGNTFEIFIPLGGDMHEITFSTSLDFFDKLKIDFSRPCNFSRITGFQKTDTYLSVLKDNSIIIKPHTLLSGFRQELCTLKSIMTRRQQGYRTGLILRIMYLIAYPILSRQRIWLFMDRPHVADDNGKVLYEYAITRQNNARKYFIVRRGGDFDEISKWKGSRVIPFNSIRHKLLGLYAEKIITSHPDNSIIYPFWGNYPHFAGLLKSDIIFLQHGVTKDDVSYWLNKYDKNLAMIVTTSKKENESLLMYNYGYNSDIIRLTGFPRFDKLNNDNVKKQIVIMPSWRRYLKDKPREFILKSEYYRNFDSLINNENLKDACSRYGYEIVFKPHPNVYDYIDLFDSDFVRFADFSDSYHDYFNSSALLITDYSSVAFDFAYLKKPVLYYQYGNDYHFDVDTAYFNYEKDGFGEVARSEEELIDLIIEYMENGCKIRDKYARNSDDFFRFRDKNSCKRVFDQIEKLE